jgi:hypothetical protein
MLIQEEIKKNIKEKGLRPLGNKLRLTQTDNQYNARLFLFAQKADGELYYQTFINYAEQTPPPFAFEILFGRIHTIYQEPYGLVFPYERTEIRPGYSEWFREATLSCNETLRNFQAADHNYDMLVRYIKELFDWTILVPGNFDLNSAEAKEIFSDPPDNGYPPLSV